MDDNFEIVISKRSVDLLDYCVYMLPSFSFDAINAIALLNQLIDEADSGFLDYLDSKVSEDEIDNAIYSIIAEKNLPTKKESSSKKEISKETEESEKSDHDSDIFFMGEDGKVHKYPISDDVLKVFLEMGRTLSRNKIEKFEPKHVLAAMFEVNNPTLMDFFNLLQISYDKAKSYFIRKQLKTENAFNIPDSLTGFLELLNEKVDAKKQCEILGRDKEVEKIWNISLKRNKRNTIIVGEAGVGKSALIDKITYDIVAGKCPKEFKGFGVVSLDVNSLIAGTTYRGQAEERIKDLIDFLKETNNIILFIDEAHTIMGAGSCGREGEMDLSNALKPILARGETIVICATTYKEYYNYFAQDTALSRRFELVEVLEPSSNEIWPMIKNKVKALSNFHHVKISKQMVEYAIMIANCFAFQKKNPDKTLDLIDRSMVVAKRQGKEEIDKECIIANFNIYYELYNGMNEDSRKEIAYHEAGHYIAFKELSDSLVDVKTLAVSILPAENYLGVTCTEKCKDKMPFENKDYFINLLAADLAGRVAEKVFRKEHTAGANADLRYATMQAYKVVTELGFESDTDDVEDEIFLNTPDYPMLNEKSVDIINGKVSKLKKIAKRKAEKIITENLDFLEAMVKLLLKKGIVTEKELDKLWIKFKKKKQNA